MTPDDRLKRLEQIEANILGICVAKPLLHLPVLDDLEFLCTELRKALAIEAVAVEALKKIGDESNWGRPIAEARQALTEISKLKGDS